MTREEILAMPAGRELDALVAEKVFGLQIRWQQDEWTDLYPIDERDVIVDYFSTDISAAWEVVEKLKEIATHVTINNASETSLGVRNGTADIGDWHCNFHIVESHYVYAKTATEAICKAALLAVLEESL